MIGFDFEVFKFDWLVVFKDFISDEYTVIINDKDLLKNYYEENKKQLFVGFNNSRYDNYIIKSILLGKDPYHVSNSIINNNQPWRLADWNSIPLISYDVSFGLGYTSLKENEAYLGIGIDECQIDFEKITPLTDDEMKLVIEYCKRDVDATQLLFDKTKNTFETKLQLLTTFNLDNSYLNKSSQKIIEKILGAEKRVSFEDEYDGFDFSQLNLKIKKYQSIINHFKQPIEKDYKNISFEMELGGINHYFGIGGLHGAISNFNYKGDIMIIDVASYYPSMMIEYDWFARSIPENKKKLYAQMKKDRIHLKKTNKRLSDAYKLVLNTTYGCYKYQWGTLLDPRMANNITIGGQVMLVDLIEQIEPYCKLIQSNTDGIILIPNNKDKIIEAVSDWEKRTKMVMEIDYAKQIFQKDVNNYVLEFDKGYIKAVGGYVRQYNGNQIRNTTAVIDKAIVENLIHNVPIEDYILSNNNIEDYQIISKVGRTYDKVFIDNDGVITEVNKVNRCFAGYNHGELFKQKEGKNRERVASHPDTAFIWNTSINDLDISKINKDWYINLAYNKLNDYIGGDK